MVTRVGVGWGKSRKKDDCSVLFWSLLNSIKQMVFFSRFYGGVAVVVVRIDRYNIPLKFCEINKCQPVYETTVGLDEISAIGFFLSNILTFHTFSGFYGNYRYVQL